MAVAGKKPDEMGSFCLMLDTYNVSAIGYPD
jgi:hypothetical protein